jgi:ADP-heptose:LPS heptosyltransferase
MEPRNILVLDLGQLGDVVLSLPALAALRARFPEARITVTCGLAAAQIVEMSGAADRLLPVDRVALRDGPKTRSIARIFGLVRRVRRERFDLAIDLHSFWETNLLGFLSGAPARLFSDRRDRTLASLATMRAPREDRSRHLVDRYLGVLAPLGIHDAPRVPRLKTRPEDDAAVAALLRERGATAERPLAGFFPGAGAPDKRWPLGSFGEAASVLEKQDGLRPVVILGPEEGAIAREAQSTFPASSIILGGLTLSQLASLAARLVVLVSNDTGPMHVAAAVGTPVVMLSNEFPGHELYAPVGENRRILARPKVAQIAPAEVCDAARSLLEAAARAAETRQTG